MWNEGRHSGEYQDVRVDDVRLSTYLERYYILVIYVVSFQAKILVGGSEPVLNLGV